MTVRYRLIPNTPTASFDLSLVVPDGVRWADIEVVIRRIGGKGLAELAVLDKYENRLTVSLTFQRADRALRSHELLNYRLAVLRMLEVTHGVKVAA